MIGEQMMAEGEELKKLREKQLGKSFLDKYEENKEVWDKAPRLNDPDLLKKIKDVVILGLVEEYGMDLSEPERPAEPTRMDLRSLHDQIFDTEDKRIIDTPEVKPLSQKPIAKSKLAEEVTV